MTTVMMTIYDGSLARNFLLTPFFQELKARASRIVLVTPAADDPAFVAEFGGPGVAIEPYEDSLPSSLERLIIVANEIHDTRVEGVNPTKRVKRLARSRASRFWRVATAIERLVPGRHGWALRVMERLIARAAPKSPHWDALLEKHRPDVLFLTFLFSPLELPLLLAARRHGVPTVGMSFSWDRFSTRAFLLNRVDRLAICNERNLEQLRTYYDYAGYGPDDLRVTGAPLHDLFARALPEAPPREDFFRRHGLDPRLPLVTFTTGPPNISPEEPRLLEATLAALKETGVEANVLVRFHPNEDKGRYEAVLRAHPEVRIQPPGRRRPGVPNRWGIDYHPSREDLLDYLALLRHSALVVNVASTVTIDAAMVDTPVVNLAFDAAPRPYEASIRRYYDYAHYRDVVATGGVQVARSREELPGLLLRYLADRDADREGRERLVREQCFRLDGRSGERLVTFILEQAKSHRDAPALHPPTRQVIP